jgi:hypothetical protein
MVGRHFCNDVRRLIGCNSAACDADLHGTLFDMVILLKGSGSHSGCKEPEADHVMVLLAVKVLLTQPAFLPEP